MAISTYSELKLAIENWLGRTELTNRIPEFISLAEDRIAKVLRVAAMETSGDLTISAQTVAVPTGFLEARRLYLNSNTGKRLDYFAPGAFWLRQAVSESGQPDIFTIEGQSFVFAPSPDTTYTGKLLYYKRFTDLSGASDTNWILSNARGLYLYGALLEAYTFLEDDAGAMKYALMFDQLMNETNEADQRFRAPRNVTVRSEAMVV